MEIKQLWSKYPGTIMGAGAVVTGGGLLAYELNKPKSQQSTLNTAADVLTLGAGAIGTPLVYFIEKAHKNDDKELKAAWDKLAQKNTVPSPTNNEPVKKDPVKSDPVPTEQTSFANNVAEAAKRSISSLLGSPKI